MIGDRGVSEVLDTILLIGMISITISVILLYGIPIINMSKESIKERNVLSQFVYLSEQLSKVSTDVSPVIKNKISFSGGSIRIKGGFVVNMTVTNSTGIVYRLNEDLGKIEFVSSDYMISIENGGVFGDLVYSPPRIYKKDGHLSFAIFKLQGEGSAGGTLSSFANIVMKFNSTQKYEFSNGTLILEVYTDHINAWKQFFEAIGNVTELNNGVKVEIEFDRLTLNVYTIDVVIS